MAENISKEILLEVLGTLSQLRKNFPYTLLLHILSVEQALAFLDVFAGTEVKFPTQQELLECVTFSIIQKYGSYERAPKEIINGLSKRRYNELLQAIDSCN